MAHFYVLKIGYFFMDAACEPYQYPKPILTTKLEDALILTDNEFRNSNLEAIQYYMDLGFELCKIELTPLHEVPLN